MFDYGTFHFGVGDVESFQVGAIPVWNTLCSNMVSTLMVLHKCAYNNIYYIRIEISPMLLTNVLSKVP